MDYSTLPGLDKPVSRLVQGTMMIGTKDLDKSFALLDSVFEQGGTAFDTAHVYGGGDCERAFGQWLQARGLREKIVIIGKGAHPNQDRARRVTPFDIASDLHDSLARLQTDYIDVYLLHRDDPSVPVGPIVEALNEHQRAGRILAFGGSNWTHERVQEANAYAAQHGLMPFIASSPNFSLADQIQPPWKGCVSLSGPDAQAARRWYQQQNMALITWSSLAGGFFSGRFRRDNLALLDRDDYWVNLCIEVYCNEENFQRLDRAEALAAEKSLSLLQIALAYVLSQPLNIFALTGSQTAEEYAANAAAVSVRLSPEVLAMLENGQLP